MSTWCIQTSSIFLCALWQDLGWRRSYCGVEDETFLILMQSHTVHDPFIERSHGHVLLSHIFFIFLPIFTLLEVEPSVGCYCPASHVILGHL